MNKFHWYYPGIVLKSVNILNKKKPKLPFLLTLIYGFIDLILLLVLILVMLIIDTLIIVLLVSIKLSSPLSIILLAIFGILLFIVIFIIFAIGEINKGSKFGKRVMKMKAVKKFLAWDKKLDKKYAGELY